jgi:hypothetical protein
MMLRAALKGAPLRPLAHLSGVSALAQGHGLTPHPLDGLASKQQHSLSLAAFFPQISGKAGDLGGPKIAGSPTNDDDGSINTIANDLHALTDRE